MSNLGGSAHFDIDFESAVWTFICTLPQKLPAGRSLTEAASAQAHADGSGLDFFFFFFFLFLSLCSAWNWLEEEKERRSWFCAPTNEPWEVLESVFHLTEGTR